MSFDALTWASRCRVGDASEKLLLLTLAQYANENGESWYSQEKLSFDTEIPIRTLRRKLQSLEEKDLITMTAQWRADGSRTASRIRLLISMEVLIHPPAKMAAPTATQMAAPSATYMAEQELPINHQRKNKPLKRKIISYTEEFERDIWGPYPMKAGTSKAHAFKKWTDLSEAEQQQVQTAIPVYARMEDRKNFTHHLEFFISRRIFETVGIRDGGVASMSAPAAGPSAFDRETWENLGRIYSSTNNWKSGWGPEPGARGCAMPTDLQQQFVNPGHTAH